MWIARRLNRMMKSKGRVFGDRYHARVRTPTEVRNAIHYVEQNARVHAARRGALYSAGYVDRYSSAGATEVELPDPKTWLLREGWMRAGP